MKPAMPTSRYTAPKRPAVVFEMDMWNPCESGRVTAVLLCV
jgi:hypothetical protein